MVTPLETCLAGSVKAPWLMTHLGATADVPMNLVIVVPLVSARAQPMTERSGISATGNDGGLYLPSHSPSAQCRAPIAVPPEEVMPAAESLSDRTGKLHP